MKCEDCGSRYVEYILLDETTDRLVTLCGACFDNRARFFGEATMTYWYLPALSIPPDVRNAVEEMITGLNRYLRFERERYSRLLRAYDILKKSVEEVAKLAQKTLEAEKHVWEAER
ncbi:hypothetical protein DRO58_04020 [Candidatus Bathyarchaeota archaeon]|mgnify:CR=1 FL=1|nr:MAG: hypothetical protein DRO58_04020 [Candidatus Bathyarchaeota archaeon]